VLVLDLLLRLREGQSPNLLEARLASEGQTIRSRLSGMGCRQLRAIRLADDPFASTEHGDSVGTGFDAVLQVAMRPDADAALLVGAVKGASERLGDWIDPSRSAALIGQQHVIVPGEGPIWLVFLDHWLHKHADIARAVPGLTGYCQVHADPEASRAAAEAAGFSIADFDGAAECCYADVGQFLAQMAEPEVSSRALEDEKLFIDHDRTSAVLTRVAYRVNDAG
jgi:hypothetical protein